MGDAVRGNHDGAVRRPASAADGDRPVIDRTQLTGLFDIDLRLFLPAIALTHRYPPFGALLDYMGVPSVFTAVRGQLGLRLEETTAPKDVFVIDHAERAQESL